MNDTVKNKGQDRNHQARSAFTLVELMVVVVIIGILATVVTVSVTDYLVKGKQNAARAEISQISNALQLFYTENDRYPDNDEGLSALTQPSTDHPSGLLQGDLNDPWNHPYVYVYPGLHGAFDICSFGANGQEGGTGADTDLCSWDLSGSK
jgi:general secretion pathway protein G